MTKKFRRNNSAKLVAQLRASKTKVISKEEGIIKKEEQILSSTDRIVWASRLIINLKF